MKKYAILFGCTVLAVALLWGVPRLSAGDAVSVRTVTLAVKDVSTTVLCNGKVQAADSENVYADFPCVAGEVYVQAGQSVQQGDPLFAVDVGATKEVLAGADSAVSDAVMDTLTVDAVTAPVAGVVSAVNVQAGAITNTDKPCVVISSGSSLQITAAVRERDIQQVKVGQAVTVTGVGFQKEAYRGTVTSLASAARQQYVGTQLETVVDAVVSLNPADVDDSLRVGLSAKTEILVETRQGVVLVPYDCVSQDSEEREYVYVYTEGGVAQRRRITTGEEYTDGVLVVSGVSAGERVVQNPERLSGERAAVREDG